jgi:LCP family protein required for cell wall assembly
MLDNSSTEEGIERLEKPTKKPEKGFWKIVLFAFLTIPLAIFLIVGLGTLKYPFLARAVYNFVATPTDQIMSNNGLVNILIMGKSGGTHDGADLTDTMILASISTDGTGIKLISIPRDIWVPEIMAKINSTYYWGKTGTPYFSTQETGGGISFAKEIVGKVIGQEIQYGAVIDFSSFKDIVDTLGGVEVNVENDFTDKLYPVEGRENDTCDGDKTYTCRYETITFEKGLQIMNGETALKFVRSRHAEGTEGTDLAREARQQKVISAIKDKIMKPKTLLSLKTDWKMIGMVRRYLETDIDLPTAGILARFVWDGSNSIEQLIIPEELLVNPLMSKIYNNLYVFIPKEGNGKWGEIQDWFASTLGN